MCGGMEHKQAGMYIAWEIPLWSNRQQAGIAWYTLHVHRVVALKMQVMLCFCVTDTVCMQFWRSMACTAGCISHNLQA